MDTDTEAMSRVLHHPSLFYLSSFYPSKNPAALRSGVLHTLRFLVEPFRNCWKSVHIGMGNKFGCLHSDQKVRDRGELNAVHIL